jgi:hypothetical protein
MTMNNMTINNKYELTLSTFPKAVVYQVVSVGLRDWIPFAESLIAAGVKHVTVAQAVGVKMAVVPLADLLEAAREFASGLSKPGRDEGAGGHEAG